MSPLLLPVALLACAAPDPVVVDTGVLEGDAGASDGGGVDFGEPDPDWTVEELPGHFAAAFALGLPELEQARAGMHALFSAGDGDCPGAGGGEVDEEAAWMGETCLLGCEGPDGHWYQGIGGYTTNRRPEGDGEWVQRYAMGEHLILTPEARAMTTGGHWDTTRLVDGDGQVLHFTSSFNGSWRWDDGPDWYARGASGFLELELRREGDAAAVMLDGALGLGSYALGFDQLALGGEALPDGFSGRIGLRDPAGWWWWVDGAAGAADGCGALTLGNQDTGAALCLDLAPLQAAARKVAGW